MEFPNHLSYSNDHEWVDAVEGEAKVGISSYAVDQLGDIVHLELPEVGQVFQQGDAFGTIESTKTVSDLYMPLAGKVVEVNSKATETPELLQSDAYKNGWLIKIEIIDDDSDANQLMSAEDYESFIEDGDE